MLREGCCPAVARDLLQQFDDEGTSLLTESVQSGTHLLLFRLKYLRRNTRPDKLEIAAFHGSKHLFLCAPSSVG
jgi:hypothetical protein